MELNQREIKVQASKDATLIFLSIGVFATGLNHRFRRIVWIHALTDFFHEHDTEGVIVFGGTMFQIKYGDKFCILGKCKDFVAVEVVGHIEEDNYETH